MGQRGAQAARDAVGRSIWNLARKAAKTAFGIVWQSFCSSTRDAHFGLILDHSATIGCQCYYQLQNDPVGAPKRSLVMELAMECLIHVALTGFL